MCPTSKKACTMTRRAFTRRKFTSGIGTDRPARRRPAAAAARCAGQARGGRPMKGRGARMTGSRRQEAQSIRALARGGRLAGSESLAALERPQSACRAHARTCGPGRAWRDRDRRVIAVSWWMGGQDQAQVYIGAGFRPRLDH
jgi:hypothetical protein